MLRWDLTFNLKIIMSAQDEMELFEGDSITGGHMQDAVLIKQSAARPDAPDSDPKEQAAEFQQALPTVEDLEVYRIVFELFDR